ncbi:MAG: putative bifunctional diguanylate cyclase/phosphodiesterase [Arenimonas sp.]
MALLIVCIGFTLVLLAFTWLIKRRAAAILERVDGQRAELRLALRGTGEAAWVWHLDTQEMSQIGFEPLVEGSFPARLNAIEFIQVYIHPEDAPEFQAAVENHLRGETSDIDVDYRLRHYRAGWVRVHARGRVVEHDGLGNPLRLAGVCRDVAASREADDDSRIAREVVRSMAEAVAVLDLDFQFVSVNPAFSKITGYTREEIVGKGRSLMNSEQHSGEFLERVRRQLEESGRWSGELWQKRKDRGEFLSMVEVSEVLDGKGQRSHFVAVLSDITDRKRIEQELVHLANYDALTGLPSRAMLIERLGKAIINARRNQRRVALLFLDLDNFKNVNDSLGHTAGDRLLVVVAQRLLAAARDQGMVARLSGDEFVVLVESAEDDRQIRDCATRVLAQFANPILLSESHAANLTGSIGVSIFPDHAQTPSDLLKYADIAMYQAKTEGRNTVQYFSEEMDARSRHRAQLLGALKMALARDEFALHFQPRMNLATGQIVSVEALLRWDSREMGKVAPDVFIPLAEESGQIIEIGEWVLREAIATLGRWHALGLNHLSMSINVSALQLLRSRLAGQIRALVDQFGIPEYCVELEITESMVLSQNSQPLSNLWALKDLGVALSLDDFGTGYSSLSYLKQLPIDALKIDKSFVREIGPNANDNTLVQTIIALGHSLGMTMIAEGVESEEHLQTLHQFGCDEIQGYWLSRPLPAKECLEFIQAHEQGVRLAASPTPAA